MRACRSQCKYHWKMGRGEPVSIEMVERVCLALECTSNDVLEFYRDDKKQ